ncbi:MAG: lytic transglycosylase domain-containing protein [Candidatus Acidulodesulfobacterium sp.]
MNKRILLFFVFLFFFLSVLSEKAAANQVNAAKRFNNINGFNSCIAGASIRYGVSYWIVYAIAKAESGFEPYALNINGKSYYPNSFNSAEKLLSMNLNNNFDIGLMQINKYWFNRFHYPYYYGLIPCFDIMFGTWIISRKIDTYGFNWYGISAYHSATPSLNYQYAMKLYWELKHVESRAR